MNPKRSMTLAIATAVALTGVAACGSPAGTESSAKEVVVYTADGLNDGDSSYYQQVFKAFKAETGISVKVVEAGSGEVLQRVVQEKGNPQADLLVTLPPFIQRADKQKLLEKYTPKGSEQVPAASKSPDGTYYTLINNYLCLIRNKAKLQQAPGSLEDLLAANLDGKLQYSTPGVAGDGTAFMILVRQLLGGGANAYFTKLQKNNVGPSDSTGQLAPKVDKGELLVANGDVQMNYAQSTSMPNLDIFFPAGPDGKPTTVSLPYSVGLVADARHKANAQKLLDYLFDKPAQELTTTAAGGFPARSDVKPTGAEADALFKIIDGVTIVNPDWPAIANDLDAIVDEYNKATGTL